MFIGEEPMMVNIYHNGGYEALVIYGNGGREVMARVYDEGLLERMSVCDSVLYNDVN